MYALIVLIIFTWLANVISGQVYTNIELMKSYRNTSNQFALVAVAENIKQYYQEKNIYPSTLTALSGTVGFEQMKSFTNVSQGYAISGSIVDSVWTFNRVTLFNYSQAKGDTVASITATNTCGSGSFSAAISWCGPVDSLWFRDETRENFNSAIVAQRATQQRLMQKFASYFNDKAKFPNLDQANTPMVAGNSYVLSALAGYAGTALTCTGTFTWQGVPIDCGDMFDRWGSATTYAYFSDTHIAVVSGTPIINKVGSKINIATDLNAT
jgi:hypothetical protein